ncbi:MAG: endonuclease/exonuclease/phosphatase family protein [Clostridia bacterium]|nr:endonuclease/exonuclease/phosphatase family protein [Clostridia bacterium]
MKKMMHLFLMSLLCGILPISLLLGGISVSAYTGSSSQTLTNGAEIRVMSYNTLVDDDETLGGWSWGQPLGNRGDKAAAAINYYKPDVIGLQENNYKWHVSLRKNLPDYDYVNADVPLSMPLEAKESLGKKDWMCTTMMYNTKTLELVDRELYGYSCNYWGCIQRMRYVSMALFKVKATGEHFVFISTHLDAERDDKGKSMRRQQAAELAEAINYYKETYGYPVIATGDYNTGYNDEPISIVREQAGMVSHPHNRGGIDYVLFSEGVTGKYFTVVNDKDLSGASDHQPIFADLALDNGFSFTTTTVPTEATTTEAPTTTTTVAPTTRPTQSKPIATEAPTTVATTPVISTPAVTDAAPSATETTATEVIAPVASDTEVQTPSVTTSGTKQVVDASKDHKQNEGSKNHSGSDNDNGKDNIGLIIGIAAGVATVGVIAAVAAVLIKKKK